MKAHQVKSEKTSRVVNVFGFIALVSLIVVLAATRVQAQFVTKLTTSNGVPGDEFGKVAISGNTVVADARTGPLDDTICFFEKDFGGTDAWGEIATQMAFGELPGVGFGTTVAISGNTVITNEHQANPTAGGGARVYIFERNRGGSNAWGGVTTMRPGNIDCLSVDISGDTAIAGYQYDHGGTGAAYILARNEGGPNNWGKAAELTASDGERRDVFGTRSAIDGDTAVVGAWGDDERTGSAYIFQRDEGGADSWDEVKKLVASDRTTGDGFGKHTAISGDTVIVGAANRDDLGVNSGSAYIFQRNQGGPDNWGQVAKLMGSDVATEHFFGYDVGIDGDLAIVGAPGEGDSNPGDGQFDGAGSAYIFARHAGGPNNWGEVLKLTAPDAAQSDAFGYYVAISGSTAVVGAPGNAGNTGAAYVFRVPEPSTAILAVAGLLGVLALDWQRRKQVS